MTTSLEALSRTSANDRNQYRPLFFRLSQPSDKVGLEDLLKREPRIRIFDELHGQLTELVRSLNPSLKYTRDELNVAGRAHLKGIPSEEYGVWVYYPWSDRLVHLLDEAEFALVRTDRNRNKITREEQDILATKRVGVIGLSVGQSVSLTMAQERSFGELRLADFDTLELSNLNRIRSGVHQLSVNKAVSVAREIAELDPFLKVTCFTDGITRDNIDRFFTEGGNIDLLVEECDSVDVKILARQKAKALRIPVVMDTSDRGMIDVERFDLEPDRPLLHGLVDHLDLGLAAKASSNEEKLPFVIPVIGLETMSTRMKASMLEIESTVTTWPQLASAVVLGGALVTDVHRRIMLGQFNESGRWYVDTEVLIADLQRDHGTEGATPAKTSALTTEIMVKIAAQVAVKPGLSVLPHDQIGALVDAGVKAPSAGNLQPWKFLDQGGRLFVFHDAERGDSALDGARLIPSIDVGTCLENIRLKAAELQLALEISTYPIDGNHCLVAVISAAKRAPEPYDELVDGIGERVTNRKKGDARSMPDEIVRKLMKAAAAVEGCQAHFIIDRDAMTEMAGIIAESERIRVLNPIGHDELFRKELRWSTDEAERSRDGLDLPTMELKLSEEVGFRVASDRSAMDYLAQWDAGRAFMKLTKENISSSSALVLVSAKPDPSADHWLDAGRAVQRLWLAANANGISVHPCAAPILLSHHVRFGGGVGFNAQERVLLLSLYDRLVRCASIDEREPAFMMRLSFTGSPTARSLRRPLSAMLHSYQSLTTQHG